MHPQVEDKGEKTCNESVGRVLSAEEYGWFRKAVEIAKSNLEKNEVPVAGIIVYQNEI